MYAGGQQLYSSSPNPFTYSQSDGNWTITPLSLDQSSLHSLGLNLSAPTNLSIETYGIKTSANCEMATNITFNANISAVGTVGGCSWQIQNEVGFSNDLREHFAGTIDCDDTIDRDFAHEAFVAGVWRPQGFVDQDPTQFGITICRPNITIAKVNARVAVRAAGAVGELVVAPEVEESWTAGMGTDDPQVAPLLVSPYNGRALNGYNIAEPSIWNGTS
jgi:hypothetical protein